MDASIHSSADINDDLAEGETVAETIAKLTVCFGR